MDYEPNTLHYKQVLEPHQWCDRLFGLHRSLFPKFSRPRHCPINVIYAEKLDTNTLLILTALMRQIWMLTSRVVRVRRIMKTIDAGSCFSRTTTSSLIQACCNNSLTSSLCLLSLLVSPRTSPEVYSNVSRLMQAQKCMVLIRMVLGISFTDNWQSHTSLITLITKG